MDESDKRGGMMGANDAPHQTMLGLGPISSSASRRLFDDATERGGFAQTTISGMPGISFDTNRQSLRGAMNLNNMGPSQMRTPAREINPVSMGIPAPSEVRRSSPHEVVAESLMGVSFDEPAKPVEISPQKVDLKVEPTVPESDPFAGLPGVAPKPSSLVDEEFVDLTSKLFGDDFAAGTKEEDLEDDGWDFDLPDEPAKPEPAKVELRPLPLSNLSKALLQNLLPNLKMLPKNQSLLPPSPELQKTMTMRKQTQNPAMPSRLPSLWPLLHVCSVSSGSRSPL